MGKVFRILNDAKGLSMAELKQVSDNLLKMLGKASGVYGASGQKVEKCRKCGADKIVKFGKDKNGKQRYKCKCCGATFTETSFSAVSRTRHSEAVWETYIHLLLTGASLEVCAFRCGISVRTAFIWRHKILNALQNDQDNRVMAGIIEADEKYIPVSYKGNHKKSKRFVMPREPYRRGTDNRSNNMPKACIMCAVERHGHSYAEVLGAGQSNTQMVTHAFENRLVDDSIMLSDGGKALSNYFAKKEKIELITLKSSMSGSHKGGDPEIRGIYHIQTVNNFHKRLDAFLRRYTGVATKYLNHYVSLFVWIENHKKMEASLEDSLVKYIGERSSYVAAKSLFEKPPVPVAA